jgi:hypothetical protein
MSTPIGTPATISKGATELQIVTETLYQRCVSHGRFGINAADMDANCRCATDYSTPLLLPEAKAAVLSGEDWKFGEFAFTGDEMTFGTQLLAKCPAIRTALQ